MKKILVIIFLLLLWATPSFGVLAPYYERVREMKEVLESPDLYQRLGSSKPVDAIVKKEDGYQITTEECFLRVKLTYTHPVLPIAGPTPYKLQFGKLNCPSPK